VAGGGTTQVQTPAGLGRFWAPLVRGLAPTAIHLQPLLGFPILGVVASHGHQPLKALPGGEQHE
jgi:hypothetical protein